MIALNVGNIVTVITRPDALTNTQWQGARTRLLAQGFKILMGPDVAFDAVTSTLMSGNADAAFFASLPLNVSPSTDDNPFFFYTARFGDFFSSPLSTLSNNNAAISMTLMLIVFALGPIHLVGAQGLADAESHRQSAGHGRDDGEVFDGGANLRVSAQQPAQSHGEYPLVLGIA